MDSGTFTFPGIEGLVSGQFSLTQGISPSTAVLRVKPQRMPDKLQGTLTIESDDCHLEFPDCKIDRGSVKRDSGGRVIELVLLDRRWKWKFGKISGRYNVRLDDTTLKTTTIKKPGELAKLCTDAMGEANADLANVPDDLRPEIDWDGDVPAEALATLCDELGCRVWLGTDNLLHVGPPGDGLILPTDGIIDPDITCDVPEAPDNVGILCGRSRFQADLFLEAVGKDTDGTWKLIDDLSYKPAAGWNAIDVPFFNAVNGQHQSQLARDTVFKCYRVQEPTPLIFGAPEKEYTRDQIAIETEQVVRFGEKYTDPGTGQAVTLYKNAPAIVHGVFFPRWDASENNSALNGRPPGDVWAQPEFDPIKQQFNIGDPRVYPLPFSIDTERMIVTFSDYVYRNINAGDPSEPFKPVPARVRLRCAVSVRDHKTGGWVRYAKSKPTGFHYQTDTRWIRHDEIVLGTIPIYDGSGNYVITGLKSNQADLVDPFVDQFLDAAIAEYQTKDASQLRYIGFRDDIDLDGAVTQITWTIDKSGFYTVASRNTEQLHRTISYQERRRLEEQRWMADNQANIDRQFKGGR